MRADVKLVALGLFDSRAKARAAIEAGRVRVDGRVVEKPNRTIPDGAKVEAEPAHPYVSRAGLKLARAFEVFALRAAGKVCLDLGASTGGFVQALLERGAARVYAVDVGRGQLHACLAADPRVIPLEATDARDLTAALIPEPVDLITADLAFISVTKAAGPALALAAPGAQAVILAKPQFELGRERVGKGGVVMGEGVVEETQDRLSAWFTKRGWRELARAPSPIRGGDGNREGLLHAVRTG